MLLASWLQKERLGRLVEKKLIYASLVRLAAIWKHRRWTTYLSLFDEDGGLKLPSPFERVSCAEPA
jgi:hypothetical protein